MRAATRQLLAPAGGERSAFGGEGKNGQRREEAIKLNPPLNHGPEYPRGFRCRRIERKPI